MMMKLALTSSLKVLSTLRRLVTALHAADDPGGIS
jgi:hypothetical protein